MGNVIQSGHFIQSNFDAYQKRDKGIRPVWGYIGAGIAAIGCLVGGEMQKPGARLSSKWIGKKLKFFNPTAAKGKMLQNISTRAGVAMLLLAATTFAYNIYSASKLNFKEFNQAIEESDDDTLKAMPKEERQDIFAIYGKNGQIPSVDHAARITQRIEAEVENGSQLNTNG